MRVERWRKLARWVARPLHLAEARAVGETGEPPAVVGAGAGASAAASLAVTPARAIIILGAPLTEELGLTEIARERVRAAVELWSRGGARLVVTSGGFTRGPQRSEAAAMADELVVRGVPREAILVEEKSLTTAQNAACCAELLGAAADPMAARGDAHDAAPLGEVWLVTQPFHGRRARLCFRRAGFAPRLWHIAHSIEYRDPRRALRWSLREYLAWAKAFVVR